MEESDRKWPNDRRDAGEVVARGWPQPAAAADIGINESMANGHGGECQSNLSCAAVLRCAAGPDSDVRDLT